MTRTLVRGGVDGAGRPLDVLVDAASTTIVAAGSGLGGFPSAEVLGCSGMTLLPAPAEPHAHLDKALSMDRVQNATVTSKARVSHGWHTGRTSPRRTSRIARV